MRLLLKRGNQYHRVFKLNFAKNKRSVIGNLELFDYISALLPNATDIDCHLTYFDSRNYHFSYKYFDNKDQLFVDHKLYHNHVAIYKGAKRSEMTLAEPKRNRDDANPLEMFMVAQPLPPWTTRPLAHIICNVGVLITDESLNKFNWSDNLRFDVDEDLIIDVNSHLQDQVNFGCSIYNAGNSTHDFDITTVSKSSLEKSCSHNDITLKVYMYVIPQNSAT